MMISSAILCEGAAPAVASTFENAHSAAARYPNQLAYSLIRNWRKRSKQMNCSRVAAELSGLPFSALRWHDEHFVVMRCHLNASISKCRNHYQLSQPTKRV
eukprot:scaffold475993_cov20-Prasinocladus_malaysianus.AAC.1